MSNGQQRRKPSGCVVIGGAVVNHRDGHWYVQSRFLNYLLELEQRLGSIAFFAGQYKEGNPTFFPKRLPSSIDLHIIRTGSSIPGKLLASVQQQLAYRAALAKRDFVIHFFPAALTPANQLLLRARAKVYLSYFKSDWIEWTKSQNRSIWKVGYWQMMERLECRVSDICLFRSQRHRDKLKGRCKLSAISQPILSVQKTNKGSTENHNDELSLLFIGMIAPEKGLNELIHALEALVSNGFSDFHLNLVGAPHKNALTDSGLPRAPDWLQDNINRANLEGKITIHGFIDNESELGSLYSSASIFVLPSWSEGFPRVLDEAMSYSLPIITTCVGGIGDVLTNNNDAILLQPKDPHALYLALRKLLTSPVLRNSLAKAGHRNYLKRVTDSAASQHASMLMNNTKW